METTNLDNRSLHNFTELDASSLYVHAPATRLVHSFILLSKHKLKVRWYSACQTFREETIFQIKDDLSNIIPGLIPVFMKENGIEFVNDCEFKVTLLHVNGPIVSFG